MKPNPLLIIGAIFAASFAGRTIGVADAALSGGEATPPEPKLASADAVQDAERETAAHGSDAPEGKKNEPSHQQQEETASQSQSLSSPHNAAQTDSLLSAIRERSKTLDARAIQVEDRIRILEIIEKRVEDRLVELQNNNDDLSSLIAFADEAAQKDITLLSKMYEQMKPKKAGEIFNKMEPTFAAGFLTEMSSESAALILANMSTDKAYETSMIIASRNAAVHNQ